MQSFAPGVLAFRTVSAWQGRVIAGISFAAVQVHPEPTGASTVVRLVESPAMDAAAAAMTEALGCSGLVSFDFMLDETEGRAALIEMNPRPVGSSHLGKLFGHDVCGALAAGPSISHAPLQPALPRTTLVALFPKELERAPDSAYLRSADVFHDVPADDQLLADAYLRRLQTLMPARERDIETAVGRTVCGARPAP